MNISNLKFILLFILTTSICIGQDISMQNATINQCSGSFFDSGGISGDYSANENLTLTICPDMPDMRVVLEFITLELATGVPDVLTIYDSDTVDPLNLIGSFTGDLINNPELNNITASDANLTGCLTIVFESDSALENIGWEAILSCREPCAIIDPNVSIVVPDDIGFDGESFNICYGEQITLESNPILNFGNPDDITYEWDFGEFGTGVVNNQTAIITYLEPGFYTALLTLTYQNCDPITFPVEFKASPDPVFNLSASAETVCIGDQVIFTANPESVIFTKPCGDPVSETVFIPDGTGASYSSTITNDCFADDQLITTEDDIIEVCLTIEHSFLGDLEIALVGPNGGIAILKAYDATNVANEPEFLGEALENSTSPGVGYQYCFNLSATDLLIDGPTVQVPNPSPSDPNATYPAIAPGTYLPVDSFSSLIGEPLNGDWSIQVTDLFGQDDGWVFDWSITFDETIIPVENTFEAPIVKAEWLSFPGQGLEVEAIAPNGTPDENGQIQYCQEFEIIDAFGCSFIEEICIDVFPNANIGSAEDLYACDANPDTPTEFDLTVNEDSVFEELNPDDFIITYHNSLSDAQNDANAIPNPETYLADPTETIFVRVVRILGGCVSIGNFQLIDSVFIGNLEDMFVCTTNGMGTFNLTEQQNTALGPGQNLNSHSVTYHLSQVEADLNINPIQTPVSFEISQPTEEIFVRVENNVDNTCYRVTSFDITLIAEPEILADPVDLEQCTLLQQSFDLTVNNKEALNVSVSIDTETTYHESFDDATNDVNPIADPENYENLSSPQTIWVRVESTTLSECFDISSFELSVIDSALINLEVTPLIECDDDNDGFFNNFILDLKDDEISLANPVVNVTYHLTEEDALNNVGALSSPYSNVVENSQPIYFRAVDTTQGCVQVDSFQIEVIDSPLLTPIAEPLVGCDDNNDGVLFFDLTQVEFEALGSLNPDIVEFSYHLTLADAQTGFNAIAQPTMYQNISNPQTVYIRSLDISNTIGCFDVETIELQVFNNPILNFAEPFPVCDDEAGGDLSDEIAFFDLNDVKDEITLINNELFVEFFESLDDLNNNNPINPIDSYQNATNPQTVYVRATSETTGCESESSFTIVVEPTPSLASDLEPLEICDPDNDGFAEFDLAAAIPDILNNEPDVTITFHLTQAQADLGANPIDTSVLFGSNNPDIQTLYVRAENTGPNGNDGSGCYDTRPIDLLVFSSPEIAELEDLSRCDDETPNGFANFDLTVNTPLVLGNQNATDISITYHELQTDAEQGINPIAVPENYTNLSNPQTIYVRIENITTGCIDLFNSSNDVNNTFTLTVEALPIVNSPTDLQVCDDDANDDPFPQTIFDLTEKEPEIAGLPIIPNNLEFTYYESESDLLNNIEPIDNPTEYTNITQPQDIFVKVIDLNTENQCFDYTVMTIDVLPLPSPSETNLDVLRLEECDDDNDGVAANPFDLTVSGVLIAESETVLLSYYTSEEGARNEDNDDLIANPSAYINDPNLNITDDNGNPTNIQIIYVRVDNDVAGNFCFVIVPFELQVNPAPELNADGDPFGYTLCEDDINNPGIATIFSFDDITNNLWDFDSGDSSTIIPLLDANFTPNQDVSNFSVTYYLSEQDAENDLNPLQLGYQASDGETLYIRVVNIETLCFNTGFIGEVIIVIEPRPNIAEDNPDDITNICADDINDPNVGTLDLTIQDGLINPGVPENTIVVYYAGMMNYNNSTPIADPSNYQTTQSPQTIIAEVVNTITLCESSTFVTFEVITNAIPNTDISGFDGAVVCFDENGNLVTNDQSPPVLDTGLSADNYTFLWELNGNIIPEDGPSLTATAPGTYSVTVTNINTGCSTFSSATITESSPPIFDVTIISAPFANNHIVEVTVISGNGNFEFQLDDGEWISLPPGQNSLIFSNISPGTHTISGRDDSGCGEIVIPFTLIDYPPFFTPNEDGFNDTWNITALSEIPNSGIFIFDRYGKLLKQISPNGDGWNGTFNGKPLPSQSYWFRVEFLDPVTGNSSTFRSHFVLKR